MYILGVLGPPSLQHVHPSHVVPAALEILGAHQALFLLCVLKTKAKRFKPLSARGEVEENIRLKIKEMGGGIIIIP